VDGVDLNVSLTLLNRFNVAYEIGSANGFMSSSNSLNLYAKIDWNILLHWLSVGNVKFNRWNLLYNLLVMSFLPPDGGPIAAMN